MSGMADQDQGAILSDIALALIVNLRDQRTGGVQGRQIAGLGVLLNAARDAVRREHSHGAFRHLVQFLNKNSAFGLETFNHMFVVDDLVPDIYRRTIFLQRLFDDLNGPHDASAEAARLSQYDFELMMVLHRASSSVDDA